MGRALSAGPCEDSAQPGTPHAIDQPKAAADQDDRHIDIENDLRGTLRNFGLKVGAVSPCKFEARVRELVEGWTVLAAIVKPMLTVRKTLREQYQVLHKMLLLARRPPLPFVDDGAGRRPGHGIDLSSHG